MPFDERFGFRRHVEILVETAVRLADPGCCPFEDRPNLDREQPNGALKTSRAMEDHVLRYVRDVHDLLSRELISPDTEASSSAGWTGLATWSW